MVVEGKGAAGGAARDWTRFNAFERFQKKIGDGLEHFVDRIYDPTLRFATKHRYATLAGFLALGLASVGILSSGLHPPFVR